MISSGRRGAKSARRGPQPCQKCQRATKSTRKGIDILLRILYDIASTLINECTSSKPHIIKRRGQKKEEKEKT